MEEQDLWRVCQVLAEKDDYNWKVCIDIIHPQAPRLAAFIAKRMKIKERDVGTDDFVPKCREPFNKALHRLHRHHDSSTLSELRMVDDFENCYRHSPGFSLDIQGTVDVEGQRGEAGFVTICFGSRSTFHLHIYDLHIYDTKIFI